MFNMLFSVSIIANLVELVKESHEKPIPAENWANKEAIRRDIANNVSAKQRIKNAENGKYKLTERHPEPHRDPVSGKIIIENCKLFNEDCEKYGMTKAYAWVNQGKYNLSPEEFEKEQKRIRNEIKKEYEDLYSLLR